MITLEIESVADNGTTLAAKVVCGHDLHHAVQEGQSELDRLALIWPEANHCLIDEEGDTIATIPAAAVA